MKLNGSLKIAVQRSGRLSEGSLALLKSMGLAFETYENRLFSRCRNMDCNILFLRDDDIPEYVQDGIADLGIVGSNVLDECGANVDRLLPLDFGFCSLSIAVPESSEYQAVTELNGKKIATSYPNMLETYLLTTGIEAEIITLKGCVEIAPALNVADAICDLVSTGSTLRTNRLRVIETISESQAILIGSGSIDKKKCAMVDSLLLRAQGVIEAERYKYIMFNLPKEKLNDVQNLVPGCDSPTVIPLANQAMIAVHSVVEEGRFWEVVAKIKEYGGSGILVTPIEKFIR